MKEGVTLAPMAASPDDPSFLPHVHLIGLQADQEFGLSVLNDVERLYKRRMAEMSPFDNIKEYRRTKPDALMPRVVVIIDEFQLLLADDANRVGREAAAKLVTLVKLVRAAGIHIVVATQEIGFGALAGVRDGLLAQIKLRIGLKNTVRGSEQTFSGGNQAAAQLTMRGEVVVNNEFGQIEANRIGRTPYADEVILTQLRSTWCGKFPKGNDDSVVFDGKHPVELNANLPEIHAARAHVALGRRPRVFLGKQVSATRAPQTFMLDSIPGRNLAVVGTNGGEGDEGATHLALGTLAACGLALAAQYPSGGAEFEVIDLLMEFDRDAGRVDEWLDTMRRLGHEPTIIRPGEVKQWIQDTAVELEERNSLSTPRFVFGLGFERVAPIMEREGGIGSVAPIKSLQKIFQQGPNTGLHSFFWWASGPTYLTHIEKKTDAFFSGTFVLFGAQEVAQRVNDLNTKWEGGENRALFRDTAGAQGKQKLIPYRTMEDEELGTFVAEVMK